MATDLPPDDLQALWREQPSGQTLLTIEEVRRLAASFQRRVHRRNLFEYTGGALGIAGHIVIAIVIRNPLVRAGSLLVIAGLIYVCYQVHRRASSPRAPADLAPRPGIGFLTSQLERQRDALRSVWSWYVLPPIPGLLLVLVAGAKSTAHAIINVTGLVVLSAGVVWANQHAAKGLQRQIERLASIKGDTQ